MFDFLRNLGRSDSEQLQQELSAYLDGQLAPAEIDRFQKRLAQSAELQEEVAQMQAWKQEMRGLPRRRVPRNFTLDPALYGRPVRRPASAAYPILRAATALTALLFVVVLAANMFTNAGSPQQIAMESAAQSAPAAAVEEAPLSMVTEEEQAAAPAESIILEESSEVTAEASADFAAESELLPEAEPEFSPALEAVEGTLQPESGTDGEADVAREALEAAPAEDAAEGAAEEAADAAAEVAAEEAPLPQATAAADEAFLIETAPPEANPFFANPYAVLLVILGIVLLALAALTLLAARRR